MKKKHQYFVYILECSDESYYVGVTNDFRIRTLQHERGEDERSYTAQRLPVKLVYLEVHQYINNAIKREKNLKTWSHNKKKALIEGDFEKLRQLSKKKFNKGAKSTKTVDRPHKQK
jgi:putative endonuclease